ARARRSSSTRGESRCPSPERFAAGENLVAEREVEGGKAGLGKDPAHEDEHHHVDGWAAEVDELADRFHAALENQQLEEPHEQETGPAGTGWRRRCSRRRYAHRTSTSRRCCSQSQVLLSCGTGAKSSL